MKTIPVLITAAALAVSFPVFAKDHGKGRGNDGDDHGNGKKAVIHEKVVIKKFAPRDRDAIIVYFQKEKKHKRIPPGLAKKLPIEIERKIVINTIAPPEAMAAALPLPPALLPLLPPPPPGVMMMTVSGKAMQVDIKTNMVLDVFDLGL